MPWIVRKISNGEYLVNTFRSPPNKPDFAKVLEGAVSAEPSLDINDLEVAEITEAEYETVFKADPTVAAGRAKANEERLMSDRKVLLSVLFDMANQIRALEGKQPVTRQQFINNLKSRR